MKTSTTSLEIAIEAVLAAGKSIMEIYRKPDFKTGLKEDSSPLTEADLAASIDINSCLNKTSYPIINEENKNEEFSIRKEWEYCWIVDPLDGTKEFVKRNGEFTVNIALCKNGIPIIGVIYAPVTRELYYGDVQKKEAFKTVLYENHSLRNSLFNSSDRIFPSEFDKKTIRVVVSRSHMNPETSDFIAEMKKTYDKVEIVPKGSSLKFCLVAEGKADNYPRFAPTMEWDTAAGQAICNAVGLQVLARDTQKMLKYNKANLYNPYFIVKH